MKSYKLIILALGLLCAYSCANKATVDCTIQQAPNSQIIVKQLNINSYEILDTVKTNAAGNFKYSIKIEKGQPEFIYLFYSDKSVAALLLEAGENAVVTADTLGSYTVEGSEGSLKLQEVDRRYSDFIYKMAELVNTSDAEGLPQSARQAIQEEITKLYISHYRECVKYVMSNPYSLTVVPVLFENLSEYTPVFAQKTDAIFFQNAYDSLLTVYPESNYVKALGREAKARTSQLNMDNKLSQAQSVNYIDLTMPDVNGKTVSLSSVETKAVLVHFWTSSNDEQKMFNIDELKPIYDEFASKGFQIYSVCVDSDKAKWAGVVKGQNLPWVNVNDGLGTASDALIYYNVTELPCSYLLLNGAFSSETIKGAGDLKKILRREL